MGHHLVDWVFNVHVLTVNALGVFWEIHETQGKKGERSAKMMRDEMSRRKCHTHRSRLIDDPYFFCLWPSVGKCLNVSHHPATKVLLISNKYFFHVMFFIFDLEKRRVHMSLSKGAGKGSLPRARPCLASAPGASSVGSTTSSWRTVPWRSRLRAEVFWAQDLPKEFENCVRMKMSQLSEEDGYSQWHPQSRRLYNVLYIHIYIYICIYIYIGLRDDNVECWRKNDRVSLISL